MIDAEVGSTVVHEQMAPEGHGPARKLDTMFTEMGQVHHIKERIDRYQREASTYRAVAAAREASSGPRVRRESLLIRALRLLLG